MSNPIFLSQVKNKPYRLGEEYAFVLESGAVVNSSNCSTGYSTLSKT
jgi:hypothetical protein